MKYVVGKMPLVMMKYIGAKYGNKNVKIILVKKCPYVVMKYVGGKSEQRTYPHGVSLLIYIYIFICHYISVWSNGMYFSAFIASNKTYEFSTATIIPQDDGGSTVTI